MTAVRRVGSLVAGALLAVACGGTAEVRPRAAVLPPAAVASSPAAARVPPATAVAAPLAERTVSGNPGPASSSLESGSVGRASPLAAINQMLTTQALLVSLLLAPVSKDTASAPLARLDHTAP